VSIYPHHRTTKLGRMTGSRRRRQSVVRAIGIVLVVAAFVAPGVSSSAAVRSEGGTWGVPKTLMDGIRLGSFGPAVQLPNGNAVALWQRSGRDTLFWAEREAEGRWSSPRKLGGAGSTIWGYDAMKEPRNKISLVWRGTNNEETGIWSQQYVAGTWTEPHFEVPTTGPSGFRWVSLATARRVTAVMWGETTAEGGQEIKVAVRRGRGDMTILPPLPTAMNRAYLSVDGKGRPTVVGASNRRVLVTTYGSDGWVEEPVGPRPGYELSSPTSPRIAVASNRSGDLAVGWHEVLPNSEPSDPGTTVVRYRPSGEAVTPAHALTSESICDYRCVTLGIAADGDLVAVYPVWTGGLQADVWITRRDATTQEWQAPQSIARDVNTYAEVTQSTAPGGRSVLAIPFESGHLAVRCNAAAQCGAPVELAEPVDYSEVAIDGVKGRAVMLWGAGCAFECEFFSTLRARVFD
jgi:hypothetical protein